MSARNAAPGIAAMVLLGMCGFWWVAPIAGGRSGTGVRSDGVATRRADSVAASGGVAPVGLSGSDGTGIVAESGEGRAAGPERVTPPDLAGLMRRMENRPEAGRREDGSGSLRMNGSATTVAVARVAPDGRIVTGCVDSAAALRRSLEGADDDH